MLFSLQRRNLEGFTTLEIAFSLAILGVLFFVAVPSLQSIHLKSSLIIEKERVVSLLRYAMTSCLREEKEIALIQEDKKLILMDTNTRAHLHEITLGKKTGISGNRALLFTCYTSGVALPATITVSSAGSSKQCRIAIALRGMISDECNN
jgi:Tfp pilus assembly protein FimT